MTAEGKGSGTNESQAAPQIWDETWRETPSSLDAPACWHGSTLFNQIESGRRDRSRRRSRTRPNDSTRTLGGCSFLGLGRDLTGGRYRGSQYYLCMCLRGGRAAGERERERLAWTFWSRASRDSRHSQQTREEINSAADFQSVIRGASETTPTVALHASHRRDPTVL